MKSKIFTLAAIAIFLVSCSTKKTTTVAATQPVEAAKAVTLTPELAAGQDLYTNNCVKCHKLYEPKKFTKEEWTPILVRMGKKAHLDETQMASITNYIDSQL